MVTQEKLKELFNYNSETGDLIRLVSVSSNTSVGDVLGKNSGYGYLYIRINGTSYLAHRLVWLYMTGEWPKGQIDHINHNGRDNRFINLRDVSRKENLRNASISKANKSGVTGVSWDKNKETWLVHISTDKKQKKLGGRKDKFEAICIRKSAENKYGYHKNHGS